METNTAVSENFWTQASRQRCVGFGSVLETSVELNIVSEHLSQQSFWDILLISISSLAPKTTASAGPMASSPVAISTELGSATF
eukprot:CAMPEP_0172668846 /NCGR_PEP_ID=MMETSP1074-20121228/9314_1 /TAXON_ID=2916 /ORGANISM="Ceratium fusus, Strain PA161109" /LENGTH=83 /DNA_ID=CAMNT_0013485545 /DNA_START=205 /DNA_END=456 /DNA_ORIENTATION=-